MRFKMTALALGLLLLVAPGAFAQYGSGSGTQTFTFPTLTVGPGPFVSSGTTTFSGTFSATGDFALGGDLIFEGSTADDFELTLTVTDPTTPDKTITLPDFTGAVLVSSLATNSPDIANSIWGVSNGLAFGGATGANGFELTLGPQDDPSADIAVSVPNTVASTLLISSLTTNDVDVANSIWGVSNGLAFGGATGANGFELTLSPQADPGADIAVTVPNTVAGTLLMSSLATNDKDVSNSVWGESNALVFEGLTADANQISLSPADGAGILTLPALTGTVLLSGATNVQAGSTVIGSTTALGLTSDAFTFDTVTDTNTEWAVNMQDAINQTWLTITDGADATDIFTMVESMESDPGITMQLVDGTDTVKWEMDAGTTASYLTNVNNGSINSTVRQYENRITNSFNSFVAHEYQGTVAFTDNTKADLLLIPISDTDVAAGTFSYSAKEAGAGIIISNSGLAQFSCVNESDAEVCTITMQAAETTAVDGDSGATMACTAAIDADETNAVMLNLTCDTSSAAGGNIWWKVDFLAPIVGTVVVQ